MTKEIRLTKGQVALVDDEDFEYLNQWNWYVSRSGYAVRTHGIFRKTILMHRLISNTPDGYETDHIDRNRLNNQKNNLRVCTVSENQHNKGMNSDNKSGYKGVSWDAKNNKWRASIRYNNKTYNAGRYETAEEAAGAYDEMAVKLHGNFASTNF